MKQEASFEEEIKAMAYDEGFDLVGIASINDAALAETIGHYQRWLDLGFDASMSYLKRHRQMKGDPEKFLEGVQSVVAVGLLYGVESSINEIHVNRNNPAEQPQEVVDNKGAFSIYTWGPDYHEVVEKRLSNLQLAIERRFPAAKNRFYVDTRPVLDRFWAQQAGLGWIGKNTCLINRKQGSFIFLGGLMTTLRLRPDAQHPDHCGRCRKCLDACPTQALVEPHVLNSNLCIAYHTVENRAEVPAILAEKFSNWIAGCDICQTVCPWNNPMTLGQSFTPQNDLRFLSLIELSQIDEETYREKTAGLSISRIKHQAFLRNIAIALKNISEDQI